MKTLSSPIKSLSSMTVAEQAYMARRLPRTYRSMLVRSRASAAAGVREPRPGDRRRARLCGIDRPRHRATVAQRLNSIPARARTAPQAVGYYMTRDRKIREMLVAHTGYEWAQLTSHSRVHDLVRARQAAMYLLLRHTHFNLPQVGALFGGRDHTTVIHARDKVAAAPADFADIIEPIEHQLGVQ